MQLESLEYRRVEVSLLQYKFRIIDDKLIYIGIFQVDHKDIKKELQYYGIGEINTEDSNMFGALKGSKKDEEENITSQLSITEMREMFDKIRKLFLETYKNVKNEIPTC